jgi:O-antigen ligase
MRRASIPTGAWRSKAAVGAACVLVAVAAAVTALSPAAAALSVPLMLAAAVAVSHRAATLRISTRVVAVVALAALVALTAVAPPAALVAAGGICVAAIAGRYRRALLGAIRWAGRVVALPIGVGVCAALALAVAVHPRTAALAAGGAIALAGAWGLRRRAGRLAIGLLKPVAALAVVLAACGLAFAVAVSPAATLLAALVAGIVALAFRSPALALGAAVLLFEFEGSVKILLGLDGTPLPGGNRAAGAAALDVALLAAVAGVLLTDRLRAPRELWAAATRAERAVVAIIGAWLALSVVQIAQGGDIERGLHGFRLFHWYTLVAVAALTVFANPRLRGAALRGSLAVGLVVSLYAAVRVAIGPADAERAFATAVPTVTMYGDTLRAVGSFSSAVGLSTFLTPVAVFALVLGLLLPRLRLLSWTVAGLALVALIGSFSRASLFGVALGLVCGLLLVFVASDLPTRRKLASAMVVMAILAATYGGLWAASQASPQLRERAQGVLNPFGDESVRLRLETWEKELGSVPDHPLGHGVGTVGAASAPTQRQLRTTDNSFVKVLVEQGIPGLALFAVGMIGAVALLARRLRTAAPGALRPAGLAALAGFVAFLGLALAGESVEQPGKVVAWALLGIAAACAFGRPAEEGETV